MSHQIYWIAITGAVLWPALLVFVIARGLRRGRGPGAIGWSAIFLVSTAWVLGVWAFLWEPKTLAIRRLEVVTQDWRGEPLRIGVLGDTHGDGPHMDAARVKRIVRQMNAQKPDIILLLGDYVSGHAPPDERSEAANQRIAASITALGELEAPLGVHAVLGNHDWWYDGPLVAQTLDRAGIGVLDNAARRIARPDADASGPDASGSGFWLGGLADYESTVRLPSFNDMLARVNTDEPVLAMSHWPDAFAVMPDRVALLVAAHSHCGQVNLPWLGRLMHASAGSAKWPCGLYEERGRRLYVTGGVGTSVLPVRFLQPPEFAIVTIRRE